MNWANRRKREQAAVCVEREQVLAAQVFRARGAAPTVTFCASEPVDGDVAAALARLKQKFGLQRFRCTTLMPSGEYRFLVLESPQVPAEELREAVRWRLGELLDYPPDAAIIDTLPIAIDLEGKTHPTSLHVVAAERRNVEVLAQQFRRAEIPLDCIDVAELALRNLALLFAEPGMGVALAWFDRKGSGITFVAGGELCIVRHLDPTSDEAVAALAAQDSRRLERVELGLQRSIDHFERNFSAVPISRILLAPFEGAAAMAEYLSGHLSLPVQLADFERVLDLSATPELRDPARASEMLVTLGAALRTS
jgi:MSHA biogenesis protein MshI